MAPATDAAANESVWEGGASVRTSWVSRRVSLQESRLYSQRATNGVVNSNCNGYSAVVSTENSHLPMRRATAGFQAETEARARIRKATMTCIVCERWEKARIVSASA